MKTSIILLLVTSFFVSCHSDNDMKYKHTEGNKEEIKSENPVGIQNVSGNIPDTINTIDISTHEKTDTNKEPGADRLK